MAHMKSAYIDLLVVDEKHRRKGIGRAIFQEVQKRAKKAGAKALVTGESLGQVASQTMAALGVTEDVTSMPVLRPLIGMDKVEIIRMARRIGTYDTSILPYEDCCTVFTPRHPCTRPVLADIEAAEAALDVEALVAKALEGMSIVKVIHVKNKLVNLIAKPAK